MIKPPNPLRTVAHLRAWLRDNAPDRNANTKSLNNDLCWMVAYFNALEFHDLSTKDVAEVLQAGVPKYGPRTVQAWLDDQWDCGEDNTDADVRHHLEQQLYEFWVK